VILNLLIVFINACPQLFADAAAEKLFLLNIRFTVKSKKFIFILIAIPALLILIGYFYYPIINYTYSSSDIVKTVQYDPKEIKQIEVFPFETDGIRELHIKDSHKIEEFAGFINSLRFKKLREV